jgi:tRNA1(Val) A37 N6-methylase TrmN6
MQSDVTSGSSLPPPSSGNVPASLTEDGFLGGKLRILQPEKGFRAGIDSVFLAAAVPCAAGDSVFEAGIGTGVAALCLLARNPKIQLTGIELGERYALLCEENARRNAFEANLRVIRADLRDALRRDAIAMPVPGSFSHAMANPPFHEDGKSTPSPNLLKAQAHAFGANDLELWVKVLHAMVANRGTVTLIHKAEMLSRLLQLMEQRFGDIRVSPLHPRRGAAATRVLIQGVKGSKAPTQLLPGLVLHEQAGRFTADAEAVLREGAAWPLR